MSFAQSKTGVIAGRSSVSPCSLFYMATGLIKSLRSVAGLFAPVRRNSPSKYTKYSIGRITCTETRILVDIHSPFYCAPPLVQFFGYNFYDVLSLAALHNAPLKYTKYSCGHIVCSAKKSFADFCPFSHCDPPRFGKFCGMYPLTLLFAFD